MAILNQGFRPFLENVRLAEEKGFEMVCFGDSQSLFREAYVSDTAMAMVTSRARVAMTVTNPVTRHPAVVASAAASLDELSGGRFVLGLGSGDSALYNIGEQAVKVGALREHVLLLRRLWTGEPAEWQGKTIRVNWARRPVPVMLSAEGPRTLRLAGELCEEACIGTGLLPEVVASSLETIAEGERAAGRPAGSVKSWFFAKLSLADSRDEAIDEIKMGLAASANHGFRFTFEGKHVPESLQPRILELQRRYRSEKHEELGASNPNRALLDTDPELTRYLADRFGLVGTPEDVVSQLKVLEGAGVKRVFMTAIASDPGALIRRFAEEVRPRL